VRHAQNQQSLRQKGTWIYSEILFPAGIAFTHPSKSVGETSFEKCGAVG
jgi:hypothetical protein